MTVTKSKIGFAYGDQHLKLTGSFLPYNQTGKSGLSLQLENILRGFKFVADEIKRLRPAFVVNLGDVFHNYDVVSIQALHAAGVGMELINAECRAQGIEHYLVMGNHDCSSLTPLITSLTVFVNEVCKVVTRPEQHIIAGKRIGFLPFMAEEDLPAGWNQMESCDVVFSHNEFAGAAYESGRLSENGVVTPNGPIIISGHIHKPQVVKNAYFPGSLTQDKFVGRADMTYGLCSIDLESNEVNYIRNSKSKHYVLCNSVEEVLQYVPEGVLVKLVSDEDREVVAEALKDYTYMQKRPPKAKVEGEEVASEFEKELQEPDDLLRTYVQEAKPEAMDILSEVIGGAQ